MVLSLDNHSIQPTPRIYLRDMDGWYCALDSSAVRVRCRDIPANLRCDAELFTGTGQFGGAESYRALLHLGISGLSGRMSQVGLDSQPFWFVERLPFLG